MSLIRSSMVLACLGCTTQRPTPSPPPGLDLQVGGAVVGGETLTIEIAGAGPGDEVWLFAAERPGSWCPPQLQGQCLGLDGPRRVVGQFTADAQGRVSQSLRLPTTTPTDRVWNLAAASQGSSVQVSQTQRLFGGHFWQQTTLSWDGTPGIGSTGSVVHTYEALLTAETICRLEAEFTAVPWNGTPCVSCQWTFEVSTSAMVQDPAGCSLWVGLPAASLPNPALGVYYYPSPVSGCSSIQDCFSPQIATLDGTWSFAWAGLGYAGDLVDLWELPSTLDAYP